MIGNLISMFFNFLLNIIMTIIQIIMLPLNLLVSQAFPGFSDQFTSIHVGITQAFTYVSWALAILPPAIRTTLLFIFTVEIGALVLFRSTYLTAKAWKILQTLKFW